MLRKLRNVFFSLLALVLILLALLSALLETEAGSRWLVTGAAKLAHISLGTVRGDLRTGLDLEFIDYAVAGHHYRAEKVSFRWKPATLLYSALTIQSLQAQSILVQLPPAVAKTAPSPLIQWPDLGLPVLISLEQVRLNNIDFVQGDTRLHWDKFSGSLSLGAFELSYKNLLLQHRDYRLQLSGVSELEFPYTTEADLHWQWQAQAKVAPAPVLTATPAPTSAPSPTSTQAPTQAQTPAAPLLYKGVTKLQGSLEDVQLHSQISSPVRFTVNAQSQLLDQQQQLQIAPPMTLALEWQQQTLPAPWWIPNQPVPVTSGKATAQGTWHNYQVQLLGDISLPNTPTLTVNGAAKGDLQNIQVDLLHIRTLQPVLAPAVAAPPKGTPPLIGTASLASSSAASLVAPLPAIAAMDARGLTLNGNVRWLPQLHWQVNVDAKRLDLASLIDNWPSDINAHFTTQGGRVDKVWNAEVQDLQLDGEIRGVNLQGDGNLMFNGKDFRTDALNVIVGANQLQLKGVVGEQFNLDWNLRAPLLQQVDDSVRGSLISKGQLRGDWKKPQLSLSLNAENFNWANYGVDKLELSLAPQNAKLPSAASTQKAAAKKSSAPDTAPAAAPTPTDAQAPAAFGSLSAVSEELMNDKYQLAFSANQLRVAQNRFSSIKIDGSGSINQHQLQTLLKSTSYGRLEFTVAGNFDGSEWQGKFKQLEVKIKKVPRWWLTASKPIRVGADAIQLGEQCLTTRSNLTAQVEGAELAEREQVVAEWQPNQSPAQSTNAGLDNHPAPPATRVEKYSQPQLCVQGEWVRASGAKAEVRMDSVPLRQLLALFKTEVYFAGVMDGSLKLTSRDFSLAGTEADASISTRNAELRYQYAGGATEVYPWRNFGVRATLKQAQLNADAAMEWVGYGTINAAANVDLAQQKINSGKLQAAFSNLAPLETILPFANDVKGDFRTDLTVGGTFAQPTVLGSINLRNGAANLPRLGLDLNNMEFTINSTQVGTIGLTGQVQSGDGRIALLGDLTQIGTPAWNLQGSVKGADFKVVNLTQLKATLSPDITLTANREAVHLSGDTIIPWLRANIKRLPESATQVSSDAVIVNDTFAQDEAKPPLELFTNLTLTLGDDVEFKGFGLNSKLTGKLSLLKEAQRPFFTSGYVSVEEGSYRAYGQSLTIERGRLVFQGPYENPGLDIRASRIIKDDDDTKVGLEISGTLQRPKSQVFSIPTKSESQAMMMLITGKPSSEVTKADASILLGAMSGLGVDTEGSIATEITRMFRLDQLEVKSDEGIEQSQLWMGKYLTPKLLVRYAVGIFDSAFSLGMEYHLTNHLRLEAESGETQSVDVVYKIER